MASPWGLVWVESDQRLQICYFSGFTLGICLGRVRPETSNLLLQWLHHGDLSGSSQTRDFKSATSVASPWGFVWVESDQRLQICYFSSFTLGIYLGRVRPETSNLLLQWLHLGDWSGSSQTTDFKSATSVASPWGLVWVESDHRLQICYFSGFTLGIYLGRVRPETSNLLLQWLHLGDWSGSSQNRDFKSATSVASPWGFIWVESYQRPQICYFSGFTLGICMGRVRPETSNLLLQWLHLGDWSGSSHIRDFKSATSVASPWGLVWVESDHRLQICYFSGFTLGIGLGRVRPETSNLLLQWLPCQAPCELGSALGLAGLVSVYCD